MRWECGSVVAVLVLGGVCLRYVWFELMWCLERLVRLVCCRLLVRRWLGAAPAVLLCERVLFARGRRHGLRWHRTGVHSVRRGPLMRGRGRPEGAMQLLARALVYGHDLVRVRGGCRDVHGVRGR